MQEPDPHEEMEKSLMRLMPVCLSEGAQAEIEAQIDELAGGENVVRYGFSRATRWIAGLGIAAAVSVGVFVSGSGRDETARLADDGSADTGRGLVFLTGKDRIEHVSDEGLFVDSGGSAIRKVRVRVVEESRIRDRETGIEVMLKEPRVEMYLVPVSTF